MIRDLVIFGLKLRRVIGPALLFFLWVPEAHARDDWQFWQEGGVTVYSKADYQLSFQESLRFRGDMSELYFIQGKVVNAYRLRPWLRVALNYSYIQAKDAQNSWKDEHRPEVEFSPAFRSGRLAVNHRLRVEMRMIEGGPGEEDWRIRNRFELEWRLPFMEEQLRIFANEELFYATPPDQWNQNRFFAGLRFRMGASASAQLAWGVQSVRRGGDWEDRQIVLSGLSFRF